MNKTFSLIRREFKSKVFTRMFIVSTLLGPLVILGFYYLPVYFQQNPLGDMLVIQYVDESGLWGERLGDLFQDQEAKTPQHIFSAVESTVYQEHQASFRESLQSGDVDIVILIPRDVLQGGEIRFLYASLPKLAFMRELRYQLSKAVNRIRLEQAGLPPGQIDHLISGVTIRPLKIDQSGESEGDLDAQWAVAFVFLLMVYTTIIFYGTAVMRGVLEEKTSRIMEVLLSSARPIQLMLGKLFGVGSVGLFQYLLWVSIALVGSKVLNLTLPIGMTSLKLEPSMFLFFIVFFLLGYFQFSAILAAVGAVCSSQEDAQALSTPIMFVIIIPFLISISLATSDLSGSTAQMLSLLPFFAPMLMFLRIILANPAAWEILAAVVINIAAIIVLSYLAARIYRIGVLMYGKRPGFAEIARWIGRS